MILRTSLKASHSGVPKGNFLGHRRGGMVLCLPDNDPQLAQRRTPPHTPGYPRTCRRECPDTHTPLPQNTLTSM